MLKNFRRYSWRLTHEPLSFTAEALNRWTKTRIQNDTLERDFLFTGCGASGTNWLQLLLYQNGVDATHDCWLGRNGIVANACLGSEVWIYAWNRKGQPHYILMKVNVGEFKKVVHIVRQPLHAIGSVLQKWQSSGYVWPHVRAGLPALDFEREPNLRDAAYYWLHWNRNIETISHARFQIEAISGNPGIFFSEINRPFRGKVPPLRANASGVKSYPTWQEIAAKDPSLAEELRALSITYGYD